MSIQAKKKKRIIRRKHHIKNTISISSDRLRLTVFKSLTHIYAQVIDDVAGNTVASASTLDKEVIALFKADMTRTDKSKLVGEIIGKRALAADVKKIAFDRNGNVYHGRVKALADAARKAGLEF